MKRGPKPKTAKNSPRRLPDAAALEGLVPTSTLATDAQAEFQRLAIVMDLRSMLERVDVAVLTECARVKARLDQAYRDDETKMITQLIAQRRGLLRELGLTLHPSRSHVHTNAKSAAELAGKWGDKLKIVGD